MTSLNMNLSIPFPGVSTNYVLSINSNFVIIDRHNHTNIGLSINQDSIIWEGVEFQAYPIRSVTGVSLQNQLIDPTEVRTLFTDEGDLYYIDGTTPDANTIQITKNGSLAVIGSYNGFYGNMTAFNAAATYTETADSYTFTSDGVTTIYAKNFSTDTSFGSGSVFNVTGFLTIDSTKRVYTDSTFPGEIPTAGTDTFFVSMNGVITRTTVNASKNDLYQSFLTADGSNTIGYLYNNSGTFSSEYESISGSAQNVIEYILPSDQLRLGNANTAYGLYCGSGLGYKTSASTSIPTRFPIDFSEFLDTVPIEPPGSLVNTNRGCYTNTFVIGPKDFNNLAIYHGSVYTYNEIYYQFDINALYFNVIMYREQTSSQVVPILYNYNILWMDDTDPSSVNVTITAESFVCDLGININPQLFLGIKAQDKKTGEYKTGFWIQVTVFYYTYIA